MKKLLLFLGLLLAGNTTFAQDYAPLPDTGIRRYFTNSAGYLRGIRVDSVVQEAGYKRYVTFRTPRGRNSSSVDFTDSTGACWVGKNVRAYPNGEWQFPNHAKDTLFIKTGAGLGETWLFYTDTTSRWVEAKVVAVDTQTVFGVLDSVKVIELTSKNGTISLPTDSITGFRLVLSKAHGFAQVPDLYLFPYREILTNNLIPDYWYYFLSPDYLYKPPFSQLVFKNIVNWNPQQQEMFVSSVGDVFLYKSQGQNGAGLSTQSFRKDSVLEKHIFTDSVTYRFSNPNRFESFGKIPVFDTATMPEEYRRASYNVVPNSSIYIYAIDSGYCSTERFFIEIKGLLKGLSTSPYNSAETTYYKQGLEWVYYSRVGSGDGIYSKSWLVAYKKGTLECGNLLAEIKAVDREPITLKLYPQPAGNSVFLEAPGLRYPTTIRIQNLQGQLLSTQQILTAGKPIATANLPAGLYLLSVTDAGGNSAVQKLLIETH